MGGDSNFQLQFRKKVNWNLPSLVSLSFDQAVLIIELNALVTAIFVRSVWAHLAFHVGIEVPSNAFAKALFGFWVFKVGLAPLLVIFKKLFGR